MVSWSFLSQSQQCSVHQCLVPILSALKRETLTFDNPILISQQFAALPSFCLWVCRAQIKSHAGCRGWVGGGGGGVMQYFWKVSWLSRSSSVVSAAVPGRKCWLRGERVVNLTLSLWKSHQARKHVDGTPKTIVHHHPSYSGSIKTPPSTGKSLHTNKELRFCSWHNHRIISVNINLAMNI